MRLIFSQFCRTENTKMDTSRLPKIQDAERESQFGYVHGVSGPGRVYSRYILWISAVWQVKLQPVKPVQKPYIW